LHHQNPSKNLRKFRYRNVLERTGSQQLGLLGFLLTPELPDQPPDGDEQQRPEEGRNQILDLDFPEPKVDAKDSQD
jgi:hypothetical protein